MRVERRQNPQKTKFIKSLPLDIFYTFAPPKGTEFSAVGSALRSGRRGRWFESSNSDKLDFMSGFFYAVQQESFHYILHCIGSKKEAPLGRLSKNQQKTCYLTNLINLLPILVTYNPDFKSDTIIDVAFFADFATRPLIS